MGEVERQESLEVDERNFHSALFACTGVVGILESDDVEKLTDILLAKSPYDELDNFVAYTGGRQDEVKSEGRLESSHVPVPETIAGKIRGNRSLRDEIINETFLRASSNPGLLVKLGELVNDEMVHFEDFVHVLYRYCEPRGDADRILRSYTNNMSVYLLDQRYPQRKVDLLEAYKGLKEGLILLGRHFNFLHEDSSD